MGTATSVVRAMDLVPSVQFEVFEPTSDAEVHGATVTRAKAVCLCCGAVLPPDRVRIQLATDRGGTDVAFDAQGRRIGGARMTAVVMLQPGKKGRYYRLPTDRDYAAVRRAQERVVSILDDWESGRRQGLCPVPNEPTPLEEVREPVVLSACIAMECFSGVTYLLDGKRWCW